MSNYRELENIVVSMFEDDFWNNNGDIKSSINYNGKLITNTNSHYLTTLHKTILKAKALDTINYKKVKVRYMSFYKKMSYSEYVQRWKAKRTLLSEKFLTEEEYELLKEVLCDE